MTRAATTLLAGLALALAGCAAAGPASGRDAAGARAAAGTRHRAPRPGSGSCRGRSTRASPPRSTTSTASKPRRPTVRALHRQGRKGDLLPRRRQLGELPPRRWAFPRSVHRPSLRRLPRTSAGSTSAASSSFAEAARAPLRDVRAQGLRRGRARQHRRLRKQDRLPDHRCRPAPLQPLGRPPGPRLRHGGRAQERRHPGPTNSSGHSTSRSSSSASSTANAATTRPSSTTTRRSSRPSTNSNPRPTATPREGTRLQRDRQVVRPFARPWRPCEPS